RLPAPCAQVRPGCVIATSVIWGASELQLRRAYLHRPHGGAATPPRSHRIFPGMVSGRSGYLPASLADAARRRSIPSRRPCSWTPGALEIVGRRSGLDLERLDIS